jgi:chromosomal replication initiator protein
VHLLAQKERTQAEFLHTFNTLYNAGRQILLSADAGPGQIPALSDRLASRFRWGMVCELEPSDVECRFEIARQKALRLGAEIPDEVCRFVAEQVRTNIREVEGAVTRLAGHAALDGVPVTEPMAREILSDVIADRRRLVTIEHIAQTVTRHFEVKLAEVQGKRRNQVVVVPRQIGMYLARHLTGHSLGTIGGYFGGRDHSTVLYAVEKVTRKASEDGVFAALLETLRARILAGSPT